MEIPEFDVAPRFVFLGNSIVSDWRNPLATTSRAVVRALAAMGFEVTYLEPRLNSSIVGLLEQRGARPLRTFDELGSDLQYRSVEWPIARETGVWIGQFAATAGVIVALEGTPEAIEQGLVEFVSDDLQILVERPELGNDWGRSLIRRIDREEESIGFRSAVLPETWTPPRSGTLLVAYDDADLARAVADRVPDARRIVVGSADLPDWKYVSEIELPPIYGAAERILVIDTPDRPIAPARVWLPRANGAATWGVVEKTREIETGIAVDVAELSDIWDREQPELPKHLDANWVARGLVDLYLHRSTNLG